MYKLFSSCFYWNISRCACKKKTLRIKTGLKEREPLGDTPPYPHHHPAQPPQGENSSVWPLSINLWTEMARLLPSALFFFFYQDFLPFSRSTCTAPAETWATASHLLWAVSKLYRLRSHRGGCERQTGRRSSASFKIWDQVNPSLKSLPFKGPNDRCASPLVHAAPKTIMRMAFCAVTYFSLTGSYFSKYDITQTWRLSLCSHY